jgi:hypothetical protein
MCIICNCGDDGEEFMSKFQVSQKAMKDACEAMLVCAQTAKHEGERKRYDKAHKHMIRCLKEWNRTEHIRENESAKDVVI